MADEPKIVDPFAPGYVPPKADGPAIVDPFAPGYKPPEQAGIIRRALGDTAITAGKGAIGAVEAGIGLADLVSGGAAGKLADSSGLSKELAYRKGVLEEYLSPQQQVANANVERADGVIDTLGALAQNPSAIAMGLVESMPAMAGGGVIGQGLRRAGMGALGAGAIGEGAVAGGMTAEQIRQQTPGRELSAEQAALAAGAGALTAGLGAAGGAVARKLGLGDVETMLAGGQGVAKPGKGAIRSGLEGMFAEGVLEEMPQSAQEQIVQNLALGKPWDEGVAKAATMGAVLGAAMGGPIGALQAGVRQPEAAPGDAGAGGGPQIAGLLPAPGQTAIQAGSGDMRTGEQAQAEIDAIRNWTEVNEARRAEEQRKADLAAQQPPQIAGLLPAPGQSSGDRQIPPTVGPIGTELDLEQQAAADNAAAIYGARAEKERELAALAAQGPISAAAATSIRTGLADQQTARRQGEIDDAVGKGDEPLAMPAAAGETEVATQKQLDEWLTAAPRASLYAAQMAAATSSTPVTVVPHPAGGFTIAPSTLLNPRQAEAVQAIQSPESEVIRPESGPRDMPFLTPEAAKKIADKRTAATGVEHTVVPHPTKGNAYAVQRVAPPAEGAAVQPAAVSTGREQAPEVNAQQGQLKETGVSLNAPSRIAKENAVPRIDSAANEAATSLKNDLPQPTAAQAAAGNYKKGHVKVHGLDVSVENPDGSVRVAKDGSWASGTKGHYGYIRRSKGADGDQVDVNVGPKPESPKVFVVNQNDPKTGKFDEHKVMLGYETAAEAEAAYRANYPADWNGLGSVVETDVKGLKSWLKSGEAKTPFAAAAKPAPKLSAEALAGITIKQPVQLEETGETVYVERDAKTALVESRSRARKLEALLKCLRS